MKLWHLALIIWVFAAIVLAYGFQNDEKAALILGGIFLAGSFALIIASALGD